MELNTFSRILSSDPYVYIIGVAGDSGSGKTTFTNAIVSIFGDELVSTITLDDYHIYDRKSRDKRGITPLSPEANDFNRLADDVAELKKGKSIVKPVYSHKTGTIEEPVLFHPKKFVILEGLHPFVSDEIRKNLDFTIFVDPDREVKYEWKIKRDVGRRNYTPDAVIEEIERRQADYDRYVAPQRAVADCIIRISYSHYGKNLGLDRNMYRISLSMTDNQFCIEDIELNIDLCSLFTRSTHNFLIECTGSIIDGRKLRTLIVDGELIHETIRKIESAIENQTDVHPIDIFRDQEIISGSDLIRLIISWKIINSRILLENKIPV